MANKCVAIKRLDFQIFPALDGEVFQDGRSLLVNGKPFPDKWSRADWEAVEPGCRLEFTCHVAYTLRGTVTKVDWENRNGRTPFLQIVNGEFEGDTRHLEKGSLGRYGQFQVVTYQWARVEPSWLFCRGIWLSWSAYQSILEYLGEWTPFKPLSLSEVWQCVRHGADCYLPWSPENLSEALGTQGHFSLPTELRKVHNALKLADALKEDGWPTEEEGDEPQEENLELLNLWFDLDNAKWLWLKPDSLVDDKLGLACCPFTRQELEGDLYSLALKLLFPAREPFFSVRGQVFTSASGPA